jgi:hypothetical protein
VETGLYNLRRLLEPNLANNQLEEVKANYFNQLKVLIFILLPQNKIEALDGNLFDTNLVLEVVQYVL